jgi:hypothetical protein
MAPAINGANLRTEFERIIDRAGVDRLAGLVPQSLQEGERFFRASRRQTQMMKCEPEAVHVAR